MKDSAMTTGDLIKLLERLPADTVIELYGSTNGNSFFEPLTPNSLVMSSVSRRLTILADWK